MCKGNLQGGLNGDWTYYQINRSNPGRGQQKVKERQVEKPLAFFKGTC